MTRNYVKRMHLGGGRKVKKDRRETPVVRLQMIAVEMKNFKTGHEYSQPRTPFCTSFVIRRPPFQTPSAEECSATLTNRRPHRTNLPSPGKTSTQTTEKPHCFAPANLSNDSNEIKCKLEKNDRRRLVVHPTPPLKTLTFQTGPIGSRFTTPPDAEIRQDTRKLSIYEQSSSHHRHPPDKTIRHISLPSNDFERMTSPVRQPTQPPC